MNHLRYQNDKNEQSETFEQQQCRRKHNFKGSE